MRNETIGRPGLTFEALAEMTGQELGVSSWISVEQDRIEQFANCTGDRQWIHVDVERARKESPFRTPIAHGYLTLSLMAGLALEIGAVPEDTQAAFNHGLDQVRFLAPVKVGARVRLRATLISLQEQRPGVFLMKTSNVIEIEADGREAMTAETLIMLYRRRRQRDA